MSAPPPVLLIIAAAYKYGTYITDDALAILGRAGDCRRLDLRALPDGERAGAFAAAAADADAIVVAPWGGQGLETIPGWPGRAPRARVVAGTFDFRFTQISGPGGPGGFGAGRPLTVIDTSRSLTPTVAEFCLGMILNLLRDIPDQIQLVRDGQWTQEWRDIKGFTGGDLAGRRVGLAGFGVINQTLARLLRPFGCPVSACDPYVPPAVMTGLDVTPAGSLAELARDSEIFVVGIPELASTSRVIDGAVIGALPPGALFVLPTRMAVVDQDALRERVRAGQIRAAIDVFSPEPPPPGSWLRSDPNVLPTPHLAGNTAQGHRRCFRLACEDTAAVLAGREPRYAMTPRDAAIYDGDAAGLSGAGS